MPFTTASTPKRGAAEKHQVPGSLCHRLAFQGVRNWELLLSSEVHCFSNYLPVWGRGGSWEEDDRGMEGEEAGKAIGTSWAAENRSQCSGRAGKGCFPPPPCTVEMSQGVWLSFMSQNAN